MAKRLDLKPWTKFWRLTLTWNFESRKWKIWDECLCECWTVKFIERARLRNWNTRSCWCYQKECAKKILTKHGMKYTRIRHIYKWMKDRTTLATNASYKNYWLKWIKCERSCFEDFYKDMGTSYNEHVKQYGEKDTTLDRIDNSKNYCKENCRRVTMKEQQNNRTNNHSVTYKWEVYPSIKNFCEALGLDYYRTKHRIEAWRSIKNVVEIPKYGSYNLYKKIVSK